MSDPTWAPARRLAGNYDDDDGQVLDSLVTTEAAPPDPFPTAATPIPAPSPAPKRPSRLLTGTIILDPAVPGPQLLTNANPDRESFTVRVLSDNPTDYLLVAEDPNKVSTTGTAHRINSGGSQGFDAHTGPLWCALPSQQNYATNLDTTSTAGWNNGNSTLDVVPAPWDPSRNAIRATSLGSGTMGIRTPALSGFFGRSGTPVWVRARVQSSLFSTVTMAMAPSGTGTNMTSSPGTGVANPGAGWRDLVLSGIMQRDAAGVMTLYVTQNAAAAGDQLIMGDVVVLDRNWQGMTVVSFAGVSA